MSTKLSKLAAKRKELEEELAKVAAEEEAERKKREGLLPQAKVWQLLAHNDTDHQGGAGEYYSGNYYKALKTLEYLRPEPTGFIGKDGDGVLTWRSEDLGAWYVELDQRDASISLVYPAENSLFEFNDEGAEELGRFLLGSASFSRRTKAGWT